MNESTCSICKVITSIKKGTNPYFVAELETGYIVISNYQFFKGYTLFICKEHAFELHDLKSDYREKFLIEMSLVAEAVFKTFKPRKMNYELLGNNAAHMHWHLIPRHFDDVCPEGPIWWVLANEKDVQEAINARVSTEDLERMKIGLLKELKKINKFHLNIS